MILINETQSKMAQSIIWGMAKPFGICAICRKPFPTLNPSFIPCTLHRLASWQSGHRCVTSRVYALSCTKWTQSDRNLTYTGMLPTAFNIQIIDKLVSFSQKSVFHKNPIVMQANNVHTHTDTHTHTYMHARAHARRHTHTPGCLCLLWHDSWK